MSEVKPHGPVTDAAEAKEVMMGWAEGRFSHWNQITSECDMSNRAWSPTAETARADAAEVKKWAAVYEALLAGQEAEDRAAEEHAQRMRRMSR